MDIITRLRDRAAAINGAVVLPESWDPRMLEAAQTITREKLAKAILIGRMDDIQRLATESDVSLDGVQIITPETYPDLPAFEDYLFDRRRDKGMSREEAAATVREPLYFGALLVQFGVVNGMVAGAANTTANVLRAALHVVGVAPGLKTVSSSFIMVIPDFQGEDAVIMFGDCAVVPDPTAEQLADIAMSTARTRRQLLGDEPRVALLSFSTRGSAAHPDADKVVEARKIMEARGVDFPLDGELQADAAVVPQVASSKAPGSPLAGRANVLIFPDLGAGNISYKLVQRMARAEAIGPVIQGLAAPICDLSRGCSVEDIVNTSALVLLMSQ